MFILFRNYIGGAFGSAFNFWPHTAAAVMGAKKIGKPLKVLLSRDQMFMLVGYRPQAVQKLGIGAKEDGKLLGITHEADAITCFLPNIYRRYCKYITLIICMP